MATNIKAPSAEPFTAFTSPYAAMLARRTGNPAADVINQYTLMQLAGGGAQGYSDLLRQANQQALEAGRQDNAADVSKSYISAFPQIADKGVIGVLDVPSPYFTVDSTRAAQSDVITQNATQQGAFLDTANAIEALTNAGVRPPVEDIGAMITPPIQETPSVVQPYVSFGDETDRIAANAAMVRANRPSSDGNSSADDVQVTITDDGFGDPQYTFRGKNPAAVQRAYAAQRGGTSGTGGTATGSRPVVARDAVATARRYGASVTHKGDTITLSFPDGRKTQIKVNPDGSGIETRVR